MKFGPVTKCDQRNKAISKKIDHEFMSENCDVIVIFPIYGQPGTIRKPDFCYTQYGALKCFFCVDF